MRAADYVLGEQQFELDAGELTFWEDPSGKTGLNRCWPPLAVELPFDVPGSSPAWNELVLAVRWRAKAAFALSPSSRRQLGKRGRDKLSLDAGQCLEHLRRAANMLGYSGAATHNGFVNELYKLGLRFRP